MRTNARTEVLKKLVRESQYVVDPVAVAEAIIARSVARQIPPDVSSRSMPSVSPARSFRPHGTGVVPAEPPRASPGDEQDSSRVR